MVGQLAFLQDTVLLVRSELNLCTLRLWDKCHNLSIRETLIYLSIP
jgi:hypothetical protein